MKGRPCAIILVTTGDEGERIVTVLPITHAHPSNLALAVEISRATKRRLGLDDDRSWIVLTEANRFVWQCPDLRLVQPGGLASVAFGLLPRALFKEVTSKLPMPSRHAW